MIEKISSIPSGIVQASSSLPRHIATSASATNSTCSARLRTMWSCHASLREVKPLWADHGWSVTASRMPNLLPSKRMNSACIPMLDRKSLVELGPWPWVRPSRPNSVQATAKVITNEPHLGGTRRRPARQSRIVSRIQATRGPAKKNSGKMRHIVDTARNPADDFQWPARYSDIATISAARWKNPK